MTERRLLFRPRKTPSPQVALGARSVGYCHLQRGQRERHDGRNMVQFFWVLSGCVRFHLQGRSYDVAAGQIFMYLPMSIHDYEVISEEAEWHFWTMDGPLILRILDEVGMQEGHHRGGQVPVALFEQLEHDITNVSFAGERAASATAYTLLMQLQQAAHTHYSDQVSALVELIDAHWSDPELSIEAMARKLQVHRSQLSRAFHNEVGMAPMVYLNNRRIQKAQSMLKESDEKVAVIAARCGYQDPAYFARVFKQHCGVTPRAFR